MKPIHEMTRREYFSHDGPGWDFRWGQPDFDVITNQVESDCLMFPPKQESQDEAVVKSSNDTSQNSQRGV